MVAVAPLRDYRAIVARGGVAQRPGNPGQAHNQPGQRPVQQGMPRQASYQAPAPQFHGGGNQGGGSYDEPLPPDPQDLYGSQNPSQRVLAQARQRLGGLTTRPLSRFANQRHEASYGPDGDYNPRAFGGEQWRNGAQRAVSDMRNRIFDKRGQVNGYSKKDVLQQIAHLLSGAGHDARLARRARVEQPITEEDRRFLVAAVRSQQGFEVLAQEMVEPIKDLVDYEGWARKVFRYKTLGQNEFYRITKDIRATAWVIGQDGQGIESRAVGKYITPTEFKLGSFPTIDVADVYQMGYDAIERMQDTARQEIELEEDKRARAIIDVAAQSINTTITFGSLGIGAFEDVRRQIEHNRLVVEKFLINRDEVSDVVKTMSAQVDPVTERELILGGYIGSVLNAAIITSAGTDVEEVVPSGTIYAVTGPEYMGVMTSRFELFSEPFNMFAQFKMVKGVAFGEMIGFLISNPRSCAKGTRIP